MKWRGNTLELRFEKDSPKPGAPDLFSFVEDVLHVDIDTDLFSIQPEYRRQCVSMCFKNKEKCNDTLKLDNGDLKYNCGNGKTVNVSLRMPGLNNIYVRVLDLPFHFPNSKVLEALKIYGEPVSSIEYETWKNRPTVSNGTRVVRMNLTKQIPSFVYLFGVPAVIIYTGQVPTCAFCSDPAHKVKNCPKKAERAARAKTFASVTKGVATPITTPITTPTPAGTQGGPDENPFTFNAEQRQQGLEREATSLRQMISNMGTARNGSPPAASSALSPSAGCSSPAVTVTEADAEKTTKSDKSVKCLFNAALLGDEPVPVAAEDPKTTQELMLEIPHPSDQRSWNELLEDQQQEDEKSESGVRESSEWREAPTRGSRPGSGPKRYAGRRDSTGSSSSDVRGHINNVVKATLAKGLKRQGSDLTKDKTKTVKGQGDKKRSPKKNGL